MTPFAAITSHPGTFAVVILIGFVIGIAGHLSRSRVLILAGIAVIAAVSLYFVAAGAVQSSSS